MVAETSLNGVDGVLFGETCERLVYFPGSNNHCAAAAVDAHGALRVAPTDPLSALGLFPVSPYGDLKRSAWVPVAKEDGARRRSKSSDKPRQRSPQKPRATSTNGTPGTTTTAVSQQQQSTTTTTHKKNPSPSRDKDAREKIYEDIFSAPQRAQHEGGTSRRRRRRSDGLDPRQHYCLEEQSAAVLLQRIRADEAATLKEAVRLQREANPSLLLRRFLRCSGWVWLWVVLL